MAKLLKNRTVMNKALVEMRRVVGNNRKINEEDIEQMDYLMCEFEDEEIYVNFDEPPKFDAGDEDFIEDRVVFGDNGHVIEVISQSASPQDVLIVGIETTATTIEWGMTELLKNRTVMNKPQVEMRRVIGNNRKINEEDIEQMDYLMYVIKETLIKTTSSSPYFASKTILCKNQCGRLRNPKNNMVVDQCMGNSKGP
ncbi:hypothetical protein Sjap_013236 [Stephania japonica]|uniref:Cytochrome P450 n=1 Tax=Stephania japonica TaxID=461633 RepID=A0AAP0IXI7_9MAGN